jgi:hypothetical protein
MNNTAQDTSVLEVCAIRAIHAITSEQSIVVTECLLFVLMDCCLEKCMVRQQ